MRRLVILAAGLGCGGTEEPKQPFRNQADAFVVAQPAGWRPTNDHGSTRFAPSHGRQTIVVRSAPRPTEIVDGKATTNDDIVAATARVLNHYSHAHISSSTEVEDAELPGVRFVLTFIPSGQRVAYQRVHVVLFGERHVFHVVATAPQGETVDQQAVNEMVSTLMEEG